MIDPIGDRMKEFEAGVSLYLPAQKFMIVRIDGRAFHTYTRSLDRPYDTGLMGDMNETAAALCAEIGGAICAYTQSDEISVVASDLRSESSELWFGGGVQKIASVSASVATATFNSLRPGKLATFDARCFTLDSTDDVGAYLKWRQDDCRRNAISMLAHEFIGKKRVHGVGTRQRLQMLEQEGVMLDDQDAGFMNGRWLTRRTFEETVVYTHRRTGEQHEVVADRSRWVAENAPLFCDASSFEDAARSAGISV